MSEQDKDGRCGAELDLEGGQQYCPGEEDVQDEDGRCGAELDLKGGQQYCPGEEDVQDEELSFLDKGTDSSTNPLNSPRAPDGGWGWMILLGSVTVLLPVHSLMSCFSILFSGLLLELETSSATTASIFNIQMLIWSMMGPLVRPLTKEFGWRRVGYLGTFFATSSVIVSSFASSAEFLFFSHSLLCGIGGGLATGISYVIVPLYFDHRLGLANAALMAGACSSQVLVAPFIRYLLDEYGFRGAALIFGAFIMNAFVGVSLFHPLKWHMNTLQSLNNGSTAERVVALGIKQQCNNVQGPLQSPLMVLSVKRNNRVLDQANDIVHEKEIELNNSHQQITENSLYSTVSAGLPKSNLFPSDYTKELDGNSLSHFFYTLWTILVRVVKATSSDLGVLRFRRAVIIAVSVVLSNNCFNIFLMLMPFAVQAKGHTLEDAAWIMSVLGICNIIIRLIVSPLSDWKKFNHRICLMFSYALNVFALLVFPFLTDLKWMIVTAGVMGVSVGIFFTLPDLIIVKYMGIENHPATRGAVSVFTGFAYPIFGSLIGYVRDVTQGYDISMWVLATLQFVSFLCWIFMPAAVKYDNRLVSQKVSPGLA